MNFKMLKIKLFVCQAILELIVNVRPGVYKTILAHSTEWRGGGGGGGGT